MQRTPSPHVVDERPFRVLLSRAALVAALLAIGACASAGGLASLAPAARLSLATSAIPPSSRALAIAEDLYAGAASLDEVEARLKELPEAERESAIAHEVAAYLAVLRADTDAAWEHFLRAAQDPSAPLVEVYLEEALAFSRTASQRKATISFLRQLVKAHPSADVRARAAYHLVGEMRRHGRLDEIPQLREAFGFIDAWQVAGSFDNDHGKGFLTAYAPEAGIDLGATMQGARLPVGWREVKLRTLEGEVALGAALSPSRHAAAYLATWVHADEEQDAELRFTARGGLRAWVNGQLVTSEERIDRLAFDNVRSPVQLRRGWNLVLVKSTTTEGGWTLGARLTEADGRPLVGVKYASTGPEGAAAAESEGQTATKKLPSGVEKAAGEGRRAFFLGRASHLFGHVRPAVEALHSFVEEHPDSLVAAYYAAIVLWQDDERGRALDLVNRAVSVSEEKAPRLLHKRAELYARKGLYDKAQADLVKVRERTKRARDSMLELSRVLARRGFHLDRCRVLEEVGERWPDDAWALREEGLCLEARGYRKRAQERYERARSLEPGDLWGLEKLRQVAIERGNLDEALSLVRQLQRLAPEGVHLLLDEGDILRWRGDLRGAEERYRRAAELSPDWHRPRQLLGELAREKGDEELALEHLRAAEERNPEDTQLADLLDYLEPAGLGVAERFAPRIEDIEAALARAKEAKAAPGAQVLGLIDDEVTAVSQEGSARRLVTQVSVALNTQGRDELIQARIPRGKVRILHAYSVRPDGERQEASSIRDGVVRFRSLEVGSAVVLQYVHYARPQAFLPNHFVAERYFQGLGRHTERARWVLLLPKERKLSVDVSGDVKQSREEVGAVVARTFLAEDVPPVLPERFMPSPRDRLWRVSVSTVSGWDEYVRWERALLSQVFRLDSDTAALAKRLTEGATTTREKFDRLYHFVAQEIRYQQDYENTIAGVRPHACPVVLARGYGDCKDKAVLLILLAKQVGIDVHFALLRTTDAGEVLRDIPNQQFNHAIVYVPKQEGIDEGFFIDPTTDGLDMGNLRADDQGAWSLVLDPSSGEYRFLEIPYAPPEMERTRYTFDVDVRSLSEARAKLGFESRGTSASQIRQLMRNPEQAKKFYQGIARHLFPGAVVGDVTAGDHEDIWRPLSLELDLDATASLQRQGEDVRLPLPDVFPLTQTAMLAERQHPLRLGPPDSYESELKVKLPAGSRVTHLPARVDVQDPCFTVSRTATREGDEVSIRSTFTRTCVQVPSSEYARYRDNVQRARSLLADPLLFRLPPSSLARQ